MRGAATTGANATSTDFADLRSTLEASLEMEALDRLARDVLGAGSESLAPRTPKSAFVDAIVSACDEIDAIDALCDMAVSEQKTLAPRLARVRGRGPAHGAFVQVGGTVGPFTIDRELLRDGLSTVYVARKDGATTRLEVLHASSTASRSQVHRFFAAARRAARIDHAGLPRNVFAGVLDDRCVVAHAWVDGISLRERIIQTGEIRPADAWPLLRSILEALAALHRQGIAHGAICAENIVLTPSGAPVLVRVGAGHLAPGPGTFAGGTGGREPAPERIRGEPPSPRSDVYAFGALLYDVLARRSVFDQPDLVGELAAHVSREPDPLSFVAPRGWIAGDLDELVLRLLDKDPLSRPKDAGAVLEALQALAVGFGRTTGTFRDEEYDELVAALLENPSDDVAAGVLESGVDRGADPKRVGDAFRVAADELGSDDEQALSARKKLLGRAASLYEASPDGLEEAEQTYAILVELDPQDELVRSALERVYRLRGKYEPLVEMLLVQAERAQVPAERARALAKVGLLFEDSLEDPSQALVAYIRAFCERPDLDGVVDAIDRLAGDRASAWQEVLETCTQAVQEEAQPPDRRIALLGQMGRWYSTKIGRGDRALQCFQAILFTDPTNRDALSGMIDIYRRAQQWRELLEALVMLANGEASATAAQTLRMEAATIAEERLGDGDRARRFLEQVLEVDPEHALAGEALSRLRERMGDVDGFLSLLSRRANATTGEARWGLLCRMARVEEEKRKDSAAALRIYESVIREAPDHMEALLGLERAYRATGRMADLLGNLQKQIELAVTPKQKLALFEAIGQIHADEFRDPVKAAAALERALEIDPTNDSILKALGRHYRTLERWDDLARVLEQESRTRSGEFRLEKLLALGDLASVRLGQTQRALQIYERIQTLDPNNAVALDKIAKLRESAGDSAGAIAAIESLAEKASTPVERAQHYVRAARLLEQQKDSQRAADLYRSALAAKPEDPEALAGLRSIYVAQGDTDAALEVLRRELDMAQDGFGKGSIHGEMAKLYLGLDDRGRAVGAAKLALEEDPTQLDALRILADFAHADGDYKQAAAYYTRVAKHGETEHPESASWSERYIESLAKSGEQTRALALAREALERSKDDAYVLLRAAQLELEHGDPERAEKLSRDYIARFSRSLMPPQRSAAFVRLGRATRRMGKPRMAIGPFEQAVSMDPEATEPLRELIEVYRSENDAQGVQRALERLLERVSGDERIDVLMELGRASAVRGDSSAAARRFLAAHGERPKDRKILLELMRLYSDGKDWTKLVDVVIELADSVEDSPTKARYLHTAARLVATEMGNHRRAADLLDRALGLDPDLPGGAEQALDLFGRLQDHEGARKLIERQIRSAVEAKNHPRALRYLRDLAGLHLSQLRTGEAIDAYRVARDLDPENPEYDQLLADLYSSDTTKYFVEAVDAQERRVRRDPLDPAPYRALHAIYASAQREDERWCLCQTLTMLRRAEPDEETFFRRFRPPEPPVSTTSLGDTDWDELVTHRSADRLVTEVFRQIESVLVAVRGVSPEQAGHAPRDLIQPTQDPQGAARALVSTAVLFGMPLPLLYVDARRSIAMTLGGTNPSSIVIAPAGLDDRQPRKPIAFIAGANLAYLHFGLVARSLLGTASGLRSWLLAAFQLVNPRFPVPADIEGPTTEALKVLQKAIGASAKDRLVPPVAKLLERGGRVELSSWMNGVDLTADRAGLIASGDLEIALQLIQKSSDSATSVPVAERVRQLVSYSASRSYLTLRNRLQIGIGRARSPGKAPERRPKAD